MIFHVGFPCSRQLLLIGRRRVVGGADSISISNWACGRSPSRIQTVHSGEVVYKRQSLRFRVANMVGRTHLSMVCASGPLRVDSRVTTQYYWLYARICVDHWTNIPSPRHRRPQVDNPQLVNPFSPRIYNLQSRSIKWPLGEPA